ncbi:type II secretion system F family protein [uncultured Nocardioides sp.]|uniref:type II secretion system F family protein n=1 Tax=uncultured Nocardioides sp. TaxID=198441 RepID=UPI000C54C288|nr:type II secretion system F family protein [uncultured Nocardioides sp.]MAO81999.1 pilus assembly protein PilC [Nocardioides sp.]
MATNTYAYKVRDTTGRFREGKVRAGSENAVAEKLLGMGYVPLEVRRTGTGLQKEINLGRKKVTTKDLAIAARQLATMVDAGLSLLRALTILGEQVENPELRRVLVKVRQDVEAGHSLSAALAAEKLVFPPFMISMTRAGESGGFLDGALRQVAETFEADVKLRSQVKSAMTYPVVVFCMAILMCIGMLIFIVPIFEKMFTDLGGDLPAPTKVLVALSESMKYVLPTLAVLGAAGTFWWRRHSRDDNVREFIDPLKMKLPIFGQLTTKIALARFTRNLSTLLSAGVPVLASLDIVADTSGSVVIARAVHDVRNSVSQGETIAGPLARHDVFPSMTVQMIASGEEAGAVDQMLRRISQFYDEEVQATTEALTSLIEPLMIAFLGVVVGSMIMALYMPMFSVFDLIQ